MATDLEIGVRVDVPGIEVRGAGQRVLPVQRFGSILRESSDAGCDWRPTAQARGARRTQRVSSLPAENPDEFPQSRRIQRNAIPRAAGPAVASWFAARCLPPTTKAAAMPWEACCWK